jgi:O-acetyl-ADP-ribose deacetylase (regulator of RNase III)
MEGHVKKINVLQGDITRIAADAIVNAANSGLMGGGGVDGAIHKAGGTTILAECRAIVSRQGGCKTGEAVITTAGNLPAKFVIHTVGPVWNGGTSGEREKLASCYTSALHLAVQHGCSRIAFPNISTGIYRFPKKEAAEIAMKAVTGFSRRDAVIEEVIFVCFDSENLLRTQEALNKIWGG